MKDNAAERRERQQHYELRDTVNVSDMLEGVDPVALPTAWIPESRRTGCLCCSGFLSGAVVRRREIQCRTEGRGKAGALPSAPGHIHMMEESRCREPLWETVKQRTKATWCVIKLLSHEVNTERHHGEIQEIETSFSIGILVLDQWWLKWVGI